jgi:hypothetical protein
MTFADLKALIISRVKLQELCPQYQDLIIAADYDDLINVATDSFEWAYHSGVFDDSLFVEIPEATLNAHGIYINDVALTNPTGTVYLFGGASGSSAIYVDGNNKATIRILSAAGVTITVTGNAYVDVKSYNTGAAILNLDTNASALIEATQQSAITLTCIDDSFINQVISDDATAEATMSNNSYGRVRCYNSSALYYVLNDSADLNIQTFQYATSTNGLPL